jgi:putative transposase
MSKESHDPPNVKLIGWLRAKSPHLIVIEDKVIEMRVWGLTERTS